MSCQFRLTSSRIMLHGAVWPWVHIYGMLLHFLSHNSTILTPNMMINLSRRSTYPHVGNWWNCLWLGFWSDISFFSTLLHNCFMIESSLTIWRYRKLPYLSVAHSFPFTRILIFIAICGLPCTWRRYMHHQNKNQIDCFRCQAHYLLFRHIRRSRPSFKIY